MASSLADRVKDAGYTPGIKDLAALLDLFEGEDDDLALLAALEHRVFDPYDAFWILEYDVDFSGDWANFFRPACAYEGDLLAARIYRLSHNPAYWYANTLQQPPGTGGDPLYAVWATRLGP